MSEIEDIIQQDIRGGYRGSLVTPKMEREERNVLRCEALAMIEAERVGTDSCALAELEVLAADAAICAQLAGTEMALTVASHVAELLDEAVEDAIMADALETCANSKDST